MNEGKEWADVGIIIFKVMANEERYPRQRVYPEMRIEERCGGREREDVMLVERGRDEEERKTRLIGFLMMVVMKE